MAHYPHIQAANQRLGDQEFKIRAAPPAATRAARFIVTWIMRVTTQWFKLQDPGNYLIDLTWCGNVVEVLYDLVLFFFCILV